MEGDRETDRQRGTEIEIGKEEKNNVVVVRQITKFIL